MIHLSSYCIFVYSFFCIALVSKAQQVPQFIAYGKLPTWAGVAVDWHKNPKIHLYDTDLYKGHATYVARGLGHAIKFADFKVAVQHASTRKYIPFFIYDLTNQPIKKQAVVFSWALRLEDYGYTDTPESLALEVAKLLNLVQQQCKQLTGKGLLILATNPENPLNQIRMQLLLQKQDVQISTLKELIAMQGGQILNVLHGKKAIGFLRNITTEKQLLELTSKDIAVFSFIPQKIIPVAGIITTLPQTPLSHVNLLAKNRGTFNMYAMEFDKTPQLNTLWNTLVKVESNKKGFNITKATEIEAAIFWAATKPKSITLSLTKSDYREVIPLTSEFSLVHTSSILGAKAANYAFLYATLGEKWVHKAFAIGFAPYFDVMAQGAMHLVTKLTTEKNQLSKQAILLQLAAIREKIQSSIVPQQTLQSVRKLLTNYYTNKRIRLRSSTNCEDLPQFNGAGLYDSEGFNTIDDDDKLAKKILKIYASLWTNEAFVERDYYEINHAQAAMGLLIHEAFVDELANGVILTTRNKQGFADILVNVLPTNNKVVSPEPNTQAESFWINITTNRIGIINNVSNIGSIFVNNTTYEPILKELKELTWKLEKAMLIKQQQIGDTTDYGVDIEFKLMKNTAMLPVLYFKQVRLLKTILPE